MDSEQYSSSSSSCSTELSPSKAPPQISVSSPTSSGVSSSSSRFDKKKRRDGRKKFRETRHPVYRGVRERNGGKWVCEVRKPQNKSRIWLGTHTTPEMAARAHDVASLALHGKSAPLNFPDSAWVLPRARSSAADDIGRAAVRAADMFRPTSPAATASVPSPCSVAEVRPPVVGRREDIRHDPAPVQTTATVATTGAFLDEEAVFNMPLLLANMAEGMLLTPPSRHWGFDWDDVDSQVDMSLWTH